MTDQEHTLVTVFTAFDEIDAEVVKLALEADGIRCFIENAHQGGLSGVLPAKVQVLASDEERAKQIVDEHLETLDDASDENSDTDEGE